MNRLLKNIISSSLAAVTLLCTVACGSGEKKNAPYDPANPPQLNENNIEEVIAAMTTEEKVELLIGMGMAGFNAKAPVVGQTQILVPGAAGTTRPLERLGIPSIVLADGPAGLRISPIREGSEQTYYCTAFPIGTLLSSTWNTTLVEDVGKAIGDEVLEYGCDVLLGPGMNIHRNPLCGRNFEYYSEDPLLTGKTAAAYVNGVQSNGVGVSAKHFAGNNQETHRMGNDARMTTRALREIYLKGFEIMVKESQPRTIMTSYNKINGKMTSQRRDLLTTITRDEWHFNGLVMTDWYGGTDACENVYAGNDMMMPGRPGQKEQILAGLDSGFVAMADIDNSVCRLLQLIVISPRFKGYKYSDKPDMAAHAAVTRQSASEGMVLLKNDGTLPLGENIKNIAAFGNTSYRFISGGTGSGDVNEAYSISLGEGLANAGYQLNSVLQNAYEKYLNEEKAKQEEAIRKSGNPFAAFFSKKPIKEYQVSDKVVTDAVDEADIIFFTIGRNSGEFTDRKEKDDFLLSAEERTILTKVADATHKAGKKLVAVLNIGGVIETASWKDIPDAILLAWQGGQEGGNTVADILKGDVNPSGKLPMTFPVSLSDHASTKNFPVEGEEVDFATMMGQKQNVVPQNRPNIDYTNYEEDIFVGYRCFEHFATPVSYPFGYGLSYTEYEYSDFNIEKSRDGFTVTLCVSNKGEMAGKEVVQLYVAAPASDLVKPVKELKSFAKTGIIEPGQSELVTMKVKTEDLASFNSELSAWVVDKGDYQVLVGASSADIRGTLPFRVKRAVKKEVNNVMNPLEPINIIR